MTTDEELYRRWHEHSPYWVVVSDDTRAAERHFSPSAERTAPVIAAELDRRLPATGRVLEVGSGTGQHVVTFAHRRPGIEWIPSDPEPAARQSIRAWVRDTGVHNVHAPLDIDVTADGWERVAPTGLDAIVAINLLQIAPWSATTGLLRGAARLVQPGGLVVVYGCFKRGGVHLSERNADFDRSLVHRDPAWGVRDVDDVESAAAARSFRLAEVVAMPADNLLLVLHRR